MKPAARVVAVAVAVGAVTLAATACTAEGSNPPAGSQAGMAGAGVARTVPRLVDLGAGKCIPCKAMAPILEGLKVEYAGRLEVQFIDVWKDPDAATPYGIHMIPTQIFYGADGKELARHQGFMDKAAILAQWKAVGVGL